MNESAKCTHEDSITWHEDGNIGGFAKFVAYCEACRHIFSSDEAENL